jgi:hypothetical protein
MKISLPGPEQGGGRAEISRACFYTFLFLKEAIVSDK